MRMTINRTSASLLSLIFAPLLNGCKFRDFNADGNVNNKKEGEYKSGCLVTQGNSIALMDAKEKSIQAFIPSQINTRLLPIFKNLSDKNVEVAVRIQGNEAKHIRVTSLPCSYWKNKTSAFSEGVTHSFAVGANNVSGKVNLTKREGIYHIELKLMILGAYHFGTMTQTKFKKDKCLPGSENYLKSGARSFDDIPELKSKVISILKDIESVYKTNFSELHIEPVFLDDEITQLKIDKNSPTHFVSINAYKYSKYNGDIMAIMFTPCPNPYFATPTLWDLIISPSSLAHEVGHILQIATEGHLLANYPPDGMMNDEFAEIALKELMPQAKRKIYSVEFNEFILSNYKVMKPGVDKKLIEREFSATKDLFAETSSERNNYSNSSQIEKLRLQKESIIQWFDLKKPK